MGGSNPAIVSTDTPKIEAPEQNIVGKPFDFFPSKYAKYFSHRQQNLDILTTNVTRKECTNIINRRSESLFQDLVVFTIRL
jgi:hypothetical protein